MSIGKSTNRVTDLQRVSAANITSTTLAANDDHGFTDVYEQAQIQDLVTRLNDRVARDPQGFRDSLELALGSRADRQSIDDLIDAAVSGNLRLPHVRFVEPGALGIGAMGAYDARNSGTVLLDRSLLSDTGALERVFTEEVGHHFDALMGAGDAAGDEGEIFSQSLSGRTLSPAELSSLRSENDHGSVELDGRMIGVEFHGADCSTEPHQFGRLVHSRNWLDGWLFTRCACWKRCRTRGGNISSISSWLLSILMRCVRYRLNQHRHNRSCRRSSK